MSNNYQEAEQKRREAERRKAIKYNFATENTNRIYSYQTPARTKTEGVSLSGAIGKTFLYSGAFFYGLFKNLLKDTNRGRRR